MPRSFRPGAFLRSAQDQQPHPQSFPHPQLLPPQVGAATVLPPQPPQQMRSRMMMMIQLQLLLPKQFIRLPPSL